MQNKNKKKESGDRFRILYELVGFNNTHKLFLRLIKKKLANKNNINTFSIHFIKLNYIIYTSPDIFFFFPLFYAPPSSHFVSSSILLTQQPIFSKSN
jgi:hypothetical protein